MNWLVVLAAGISLPAIGADLRSQRSLQKPLLASQLEGRAAEHLKQRRRQILQLEVRAKSCVAPPRRSACIVYLCESRPINFKYLK